MIKNINMRKKICTRVNSKIGPCQNLGNISVEEDLGEGRQSASDENHKLDLVEK